MIDDPLNMLPHEQAIANLERERRELEWARRALNGMPINTPTPTITITTLDDLTAPPPPPDLEASIRDRVAEARRKKLIPPEWIVDHSIPFQYRHGGIELLFHIPVTIKEVVYEGHQYIVPDFKRKTTFVLLGLRIDHMGRYVATTLRVISPNGVCLPHVTYGEGGSACLGLGDGPVAINSHERYREMKSVIIRAMTQINLASLYSGKDQWPKEVRNALPLGTRGLRSEARRKRFNVAITKYFTHEEDPIWTSQGKTR